MARLIGAAAVSALFTGAAGLLTRPAQPAEQASRYSTSDFFCWAILTDDDTLWEVRKQMQECGGYAILGDRAKGDGLVKFLNESDGKELKKGVSSTHLFLQAWKFIADSEWPDKYKWFVKVEPDTYFRPEHLPTLTAELDAEEAMGLRVDGKIRGAVEVLSHKVFRHEKSSMIYTRSEEEMQDKNLTSEDAWLDHALTKAGMKTPEAPLSKDGCLLLLISNNNLPSRYDADHIKPEILLDSKVIKGNSDGDCSKNEVVGIHPAKSVGAYQALRRMDEDIKEGKISMDEDIKGKDKKE